MFLITNKVNMERRGEKNFLRNERIYKSILSDQQSSFSRGKQNPGPRFGQSPNNLKDSAIFDVL